MADEVAAARTTWPTKLGSRDKLYAIVNEDGIAEYLVLTSAEEKSTLVRDNGTWQKVTELFFENIDDPTAHNEDVDLDFIKYFDSFDMVGKPVPFYQEDETAMAAAAETEGDDKCPEATLDIEVNLKNRLRAINIAEYGPMDPKKENLSFWQDKADMWSTSVEDAKTSLCGTCAFFVIKKSMLDCIANGLKSGDSSSQDAWDAIDVADLGYCEAFDFKCAASRTCNAWVTGGPISDDVESKKGA